MKKLFLPLSIAALAGFFASQKPDGLDSVAQTLGFAGKAREGAGPLSGYHIPFLGESKLSAALAGIIGTIIAYCIFAAIIKIAKRHFGEKHETLHSGACADNN
jgi:hypothetical protein